MLCIAGPRKVEMWLAWAVAAWAAGAVGCGRAAPNRLPTGQQVIVTPGKTELRAGKHRTIQAPGAPVPDSFPQDIPIYPGAKFRIGSESDGKLDRTTLDVPMGDVAGIEAYYRDFFAKNGWTIGLDHRSKDGGAMMQFRKGKRSCLVTVNTTDAGTTALGFLFTEKE